VSDSSDEEAENMTVEPGATLKNGCKIYNDLFDDACKSIAKGTLANCSLPKAWKNKHDSKDGLPHSMVTYGYIQGGAPVR
jgi:hypothetical protein